MLDEVSILQEPSPVVDRSVSAELVDFSAEVLRYLRSVEEVSEVMSILSFDYREPLLIPAPEILVARAHEWARGELDSVGERILFYSADEVPLTPGPLDDGVETPRGGGEPEARVPARRRASTPLGGGKGGQQATTSPQKKRPTVASLAQSLEQISQTLPALVNQVQDLSSRTAAMEAATKQVTDRSSALRKPIGSLTMPGSPDPSNLKSLVTVMPPPKATGAQKPKVAFTQQDTEEFLTELPEQTPDFARAMLMQSHALTSLVAQIREHLRTLSTIWARPHHPCRAKGPWAGRDYKPSWLPTGALSSRVSSRTC